MSDVWILVAKAVNGGVIVCLFALLGEATSPKRFAGIFSAAPTVALANLTVAAVTVGSKDFAAYGAGMAVATAGFLAYALVCDPAVRRFGALTGSAVSVAVWAVVTAPLAWLVLW